MSHPGGTSFHTLKGFVLIKSMINQGNFIAYQSVCAPVCVDIFLSIRVYLLLDKHLPLLYFSIRRIMNGVVPDITPSIAIIK